MFYFATLLFFFVLCCDQIGLIHNQWDRLDVIQDTKWYDNLLSQCFEKNFKLSISTIDAAPRIQKSRYGRTSTFYQSYGMQLGKCEESIKYFENTIKIAPKWKNYLSYELENSLNFNNINNDSTSQNSVKQSTLFLSYLKYISFLVDGDDISKLISGFLRME